MRTLCTGVITNAVYPKSKPDTQYAIYSVLVALKVSFRPIATKRLLSPIGII